MNSSTIYEYLDYGHSYTDRCSEMAFINSYQDELFRSGVTSSRPIWVGIKVTSMCNYQCEHCWVESRDKLPSIDDIRGALDKLRELEVMHVTISGGEPFLRKDIFEIIKYSKSLRFGIEIFTNASLLTYEKCYELLDYLDIHNDTIQISLDGSNASTYLMQRHADDFYHVTSIIKLLVDIGIKVRVNYTATHINESEIYNTYRLVNDLGVITFSVSHVYDLNNGVELYDKVNKKTYYEQVEECIKLSSRVKTELRCFLPIEFYSKNAIKCTKSNLLSKYTRPIIDWFIHSDGSIFPDVSLEIDDFKIGNIYSDNVNVIMKRFSSVIKKLATRNLQNTKCEFCNQHKYCFGGDFGRAYKTYKSINHSDPRCDFELLRG